MPQNVYELSQTIQNLIPILSQETLISQLPFVSSAKDEMAKREGEFQDSLEDYVNLPEHENVGDLDGQE